MESVKHAKKKTETVAFKVNSTNTNLITTIKWHFNIDKKNITWKMKQNLIMIDINRIFSNIILK